MEKETLLQERHGHCADLLMSDYGIDGEHREQCCRQIELIWQQSSMIHCLIIASVRGFQPDRRTKSLEAWLDGKKSRPPINQKPRPMYSDGGNGDFWGNRSLDRNSW